MEPQPPTILALPQDKDVLAALGAVSVRHGQLEYILRMTVGTLVGVSQTEAFGATAKQGSQELRTRLLKLAKRRFGDGKPLVLLQALLHRAELASQQRNELIHNLWAQVLDGDTVVLGREHKPSTAPSATELEILAEEIHSITFELIKARQEGFLRAAISDGVGCSRDG